MILEYTLHAYLERLSQKCEDDSNRCYGAMVQAMKDSLNKIKARKVCDFLITLKRNHVGTNEVEHGIRKTCKLLSDVENESKNNATEDCRCI